jgi:hypothetical protein
MGQAKTVQDRIVAIEHCVQANYDVQTVVVVMLESSGETSQGHASGSA